MQRKPYPEPPPPTPQELASQAAVERLVAAQQAQLAEFDIAGERMERIAVLGMALTETVVDHALGEACPRPVAEVEPRARVAPEVAARWLGHINVPLAFGRLARTVQTVTAMKLEIAQRRVEVAQAMVAAGANASVTAQERRKRITKQLRALLAEQITRVADPADNEALLLEVDEWLANPSVVQAMGQEPIGRIVCSIIECMGYRPSLSRFTDKELGISIPWVKPERPLGMPGLPPDQLPPSKVWWTPPKAKGGGESGGG